MPKNTSQNIVISRLKLALAVSSSLAILFLLSSIVIYFRFSTLRPLVTIGSTSISKREYLANLEQSAGQRVLGEMVLGEIVRQAATHAGVMPTTQDVDSRMALMQSSSPGLIAVATQNGTIGMLREQVTTALALENLRIQRVTASEAQIERYYASHLAEFHENGHGNAALVVTDTSIDAQSAARMLSQGIDPTVIARQPGFNIVGYGGFAIDMQDPAFKHAVSVLAAMKAGQVQVLPLGKRYITVKLMSKQAGLTLPLSQVHDRVARLVKLEKAVPTNVFLTKLYQANRPTFNMSQYAAYFANIGQATRAGAGATNAVASVPNHNAAGNNP